MKEQAFRLEVCNALSGEPLTEPVRPGRSCLFGSDTSADSHEWSWSASRTRVIDVKEAIACAVGEIFVVDNHDEDDDLINNCDMLGGALSEHSKEKQMKDITCGDEDRGDTSALDIINDDGAADSLCLVLDPFTFDPSQPRVTFSAARKSEGERSERRRSWRRRHHHQQTGPGRKRRCFRENIMLLCGDKNQLPLLLEEEEEEEADLYEQESRKDRCLPSDFNEVNFLDTLERVLSQNRFHAVDETTSGTARGSAPPTGADVSCPSSSGADVVVVKIGFVVRTYTPFRNRKELEDALAPYWQIARRADHSTVGSGQGGGSFRRRYKMNKGKGLGTTEPQEQILKTEEKYGPI
ncbi:unnamed protein product [Amoebophrya sp. A120]|nr:unnamed protein product [Amoebophrya sp. A120]|eukprot:GSA120T00016346001.1